MGWRPVAAVCGLYCCLMTGCVASGQSFSMSSMSSMPWFNFEFAPKPAEKKNVQSIARQKPPGADPAGRSMPARTWDKLLGKSKGPRIPLPRTDAVPLEDDEYVANAWPENALEANEQQAAEGELSVMTVTVPSGQQIPDASRQSPVPASPSEVDAAFLKSVKLGAAVPLDSVQDNRF